MNKSDLIGRMASDAGITKAQAASALNSFTTATAEALKKGDKVILVGFGFDLIQDRYVCMSRVRWPGKKAETNNC